MRDDQRKNNLEFAHYWVKRIFPFVSKKDEILDIGAGRGEITKFLNKKCRIETTAIDTKKSRFPISGVKITVYDGRRIPFEDNSFNCAILRAVLHHSQNPEKLLLETKRVTKKYIFVFEDIYKNSWEKYSTFLFDSLINIVDGFLANTVLHPRNNKTFDEWLKIFSRLGFKVKYSHKWYSGRGDPFPFRWHFAFFVLEK